MALCLTSKSFFYYFNRTRSFFLLIFKMDVLFLIKCVTCWSCTNWISVWCVTKNNIKFAIFSQTFRYKVCHIWHTSSILSLQQNDVLNWRPPRKSGLTPKTTKARVVRYVIIQSPQWFSGLTHSSSEGSNSYILYH